MDVRTHRVIINSEPGTSSGSGSLPSSKLGLCEVCAFRNAKYTCPRCEVKTCSLKCNKIHKLEIECNGERDRTKFVAMNKFTNLDLTSDYRLLEEISRSLETSRKSFGKRWNNIPHGLIKLRNAAKSRKINLKFLPFQFARRNNNTTHFQSKSNQIFWHIEWVFVNADNLKYYDSKVPETEKLNSILDKYFGVKDESQDESLQFYQAAGLSGVRLLLKAEQKAGKKFYEIDGDMQLKECLQKKLIIEYPTIHVVLKDHGCGYNIIDSDDEDEPSQIERQLKSGNEIVNSIINKSEEDESLYKSLKNLLFISEYSDEEISDDE